ncbi:MAG: hypothetical protein ACP5IB_05700 [Thermoplasmata archaeon]|jgi:hypothetical protein
MKDRYYMTCKNCGHTIVYFPHRVPYSFFHYNDKKPKIKCYCGCERPEPDQAEFEKVIGDDKDE